MPVVKPAERAFESPWKFLGGIPIHDPDDLRRIMARLHVTLNPIIPPASDGPALTLSHLGPTSSASERAEIASRIAIMIAEAEESPLLYVMLSWYGYLCDASDEKVLAATKVIRDHVTFPVRNHPNLYHQEYAVARKEWDEFLVAFKKGVPKVKEEDVEMADEDVEMADEGIEMADDDDVDNDDDDDDDDDDDTEATTEVESSDEDFEDSDLDSDWEP